MSALCLVEAETVVSNVCGRWALRRVDELLAHAARVHACDTDIGFNHRVFKRRQPVAWQIKRSHVALVARVSSDVYVVSPRKVPIHGRLERSHTSLDTPIEFKLVIPQHYFVSSKQLLPITRVRMARKKAACALPVAR